MPFSKLSRAASWVPPDDAAAMTIVLENFDDDAVAGDHAD
jgi:hypothetical protein